MTPDSPLPEQTPADHGELARLRAEIAERDELLALAAHELRNPLHALSLQLALAHALAQQKQQAETAARIAKAQTTLARYVDRVTVLLELARLKDDAYPLDPKPVDLGAVVRARAAAMAQEAAYRNVGLEVEAPPSCPASVDTLVLEQLLDNLLLNAFKHAACTRVRLVLRTAEAGMAQIEVADDGRGTGAAEQALIVGQSGPGRRGGSSSGTGLGLWIVRKLAGVLGGAIALASEPGKGSVFTLTLPLSPPDRPSR